MPLADIPRTLEWTPPTPSAQSELRLIDQRELPHELVYVDCFNSTQVCECIESLAVRGAPAIGVAGAFAVVLWAENEWMRKNAAIAGEPGGREVFLAELDARAAEIAAVRPTAVNLGWAVAQMVELAHATGKVGTAEKATEKAGMADGNAGTSAGAMPATSATPAEITAQMRVRACEMAEEDVATCAAIAKNGADELAKLSARLGRPLRIETHCNAGSLATVHGGTALGVVYEAHARGLVERVWVDETRPVEQGARLTAWELGRAGVPYTLVCDNMAGSLMQAGKVDAVVVGADRICANGDFANKIGTYALAVLAHHHDVPFCVAAPKSSFDMELACGAEIEIEQRGAREVRCMPSGHDWLPVAPPDADVYNPAFDVTPADLVHAVFTE
jgi:methylthioribose-1-phosphate isomerase